MSASSNHRLQPASLTSLPLELLLNITSDLDPMSYYILRLSARSLYLILPPLPHTYLVLAERSDYAQKRGLRTCCACLALRPPSAFPIEPQYRFPLNGRIPAMHFVQLCMACGQRPLSDSLNPEEDEHKYLFGYRWERGDDMATGEGTERWQRCARCRVCKTGPWHETAVAADVCTSCEPLDAVEKVAFDQMLAKALTGREKVQKARRMRRMKAAMRGEIDAVACAPMQYE